MLAKEDLLDREQVSELLGVSIRTLKTWQSTGVLRGNRIGPKLLRYDRATVEAFALNREAGTQTEPTSIDSEVVQ